MVQHMQIDEQVSVGGQVDKKQLGQLAGDGFKTIINLQVHGEENQRMSPEVEGQNVRELGLQYIHFPVSKETMSADKVDDFRKLLVDRPKPIFAHCSSGKRSGALVMMARAVERGWTGVETLAIAEKMGFECDVPELKEFVKSYVDSRR